MGETNTKFTIEFTAPGPLYFGGLNIIPDAGVAPTLGTGADADGATRGDVYTVRVSGAGADVELWQPERNTSTIIDLLVHKLNKGDKITVTYTRKAPIAQPTTAGAPSFTTQMHRSNFVVPHNFRDVVGCAESTPD